MTGGEPRCFRDDEGEPRGFRDGKDNAFGVSMVPASSRGGRTRGDVESGAVGEQGGQRLRELHLDG